MKTINKKLAAVWGELRDSPADKQELIAKWKARLTPVALAKADKNQGRLAFNTACASCHILYGEGGKVGPDLTGGGRNNLDYLLENIVDPSAVVTADFRMSILDLKDGRVLNGIIAAKTERTLTIRAMTETLTVERGEIAGIRESSVSLMPEGFRLRGPIQISSHRDATRTRGPGRIMPAGNVEIMSSSSVPSCSE